MKLNNVLLNKLKTYTYILHVSIQENNGNNMNKKIVLVYMYQLEYAKCNLRTAYVVIVAIGRRQI